LRKSDRHQYEDAAMRGKKRRKCEREEREREREIAL
jgi:hypothetical protein